MSSTSVSIESESFRYSPEFSRETTRANLYLLVSRVFSSPLEMDEKLPVQLRLLIPDLPPPLQYDVLLVATAWEKALENRETLSLAYARLFLGPFDILASPYASFYIEPDQRLMGEVSQYVARAYAEAGLGPGRGPREAPDHVALEWEFMYYLTHQYVTTGEEHWLDQRKIFRSTHLDHWMPLLTKAIAQAGEHKFYNAVAVLLTVLLNNTEF